MPKKVKCFAYGSNMLTKRMTERAPSAKPLGRAKLHDKRLVCNKKSTDCSGKANLVDDTGHIVWGVLYEIDSAELDKLDNCEKGYEREKGDVITDQDSSVKAYLYISSKLTDDARAYNWYKDLLIQGAREHKLPESYIKEELEKLKVKPDPK